MLRPLSSTLRPQALAPLMAPPAAAAFLLPAAAAQRSATALGSKRQRRQLHVSPTRLAAREAPDYVSAAAPKADLTSQPIYMRRSFWAVIGALATVEGGFWLWMYLKDNKKAGQEQDVAAEAEINAAGTQAVRKA